MTRRVFLTAAAAVPSRASEQDLLNRVAELYGDPGRSFAAVARVSSTAGPAAMAGVSPPAQRSIQYSDGLYRVETRMGDRLLFLRGENESWIYRSDRNVFRQGDHASEVGQQVRHMAERTHDDLGRRFGMLGKQQADFRTTGEQEVKAAGRKIRCVVVSIQPRQAVWRERLWIERDTAIVWKSVTDSADDVRNVASTRTLEWDQVSIGGSLPRDAFAFVPPKKARRVDRFEVMQQASPPALQAPYTNP